MQTSYFANVKNIPDHLEPVGIARGVPRWFKGRSERSLAPTWAMLKMSAADYDLRFDEILEKLDPQATYDLLGENGVILCWEKPGDKCHRRRVAEWFETELGVVVPELGFDRSETLPYDLTPLSAK